MLAAGLTLLIFVILLFVGLGITAAIRRNALSLGDVLVSPALGLVAFVVPTVIINQCGVPTGRFAVVEIAVLVGLAGLSIGVFRKMVPWRGLAKFLPVIGLAFVLIGWPQFIHGFNWVSFSNDDMTNYALSADRLVTQGFYQEPPLGAETFYKGYAVGYWFEYALNGERTGVEMALSLVAAATHLRGFRVFMPFIVGVDLAVICVSGALGWAVRRRPKDALLVSFLLAVSALMAFGALYQLLAQVCGLCILAGGVAVVACRWPRELASDRLATGVTLGLLLAGQLLVYPEILPFGVLTGGILLAIALWRRYVSILDASAILGLCGVVAIGLTLSNSYKMVGLSVARALTQMPHHHVATPYYLFSYYFVPSGIANLWGLIPISVFRGEPLLSTSIAIGMVLSVWVVSVAVFRAYRNGDANAVLLLVMWAVGMVMFFRRIDFGLYKLAMYVQPFLLPIFGTAALILRRFKALAIAALAIFVFFNAITQWQYVETSENGPHGIGAGFVEVRGATSHELLNNLSALEARVRRFNAVLSDTSNLVLAKYETGYTREIPLYFLAREFRGNLHGIPSSFLDRFRPEYPNLLARAKALVASAKTLSVPESFLFSPNHRALFTMIKPSVYSHGAMLGSSQAVTIVNRSERHDAENIVYLQPLSTVRDHLIFTESSLGYAPGPGADRRLISLFQVEPDYFRKGDSMAGLGRYLLFNVIHPDRQIRLVLDISDTLAADGINALPPARLVGSTTAAFPLVGRGSAREISPPVEPRRINGAYFVGIDMGTRGKPFRVPRTGLMDLYGADITLDPRWLTAFGRNISVISDAAFKNMKIPGYLDNVAKDIATPDVLYSGIYEDGWVSDHVRLTLVSRRHNEYLWIDGVVPLIHDPNFKTTLVCKVDSKVVAAKSLSVGQIRLRIPVRVPLGRHTILLTFDRYERLPSHDGRPVSARITDIGFRATDG